MSKLLKKSIIYQLSVTYDYYLYKVFTLKKKGKQIKMFSRNLSLKTFLSNFFKEFFYVLFFRIAYDYYEKG